MVTMVVVAAMVVVVAAMMVVLVVVTPSVRSLCSLSRSRKCGRMLQDRRRRIYHPASAPVALVRQGRCLLCVSEGEGSDPEQDSNGQHNGSTRVVLQCGLYSYPRKYNSYSAKVMGTHLEKVMVTHLVPASAGRVGDPQHQRTPEAPLHQWTSQRVSLVHS